MKQTKSIAALVFFLIPATALFAQNDSIKEQDELFTLVEKMPEFPGGDKEMMAFIVANTKYPAEARKKKIQGTSFVSFVVNKQGEVTETKIIRSAHPLLDKEALRMMSLMPKWTPGTQEGKPVLVQFTLPVKFALN